MLSCAQKTAVQGQDEIDRAVIGQCRPARLGVGLEQRYGGHALNASDGECIAHLEVGARSQNGLAFHVRH